MRKHVGAALTCAGAVIGAGFASGREIVSFFTRYGGDSWWIILLACAMMTGLCWLCMRRAVSSGAQNGWHRMLDGNGTGARICMTVLLSLSGGAMTAAAGELAALSWRSEWAYSLGASGTLLAAWALGQTGRRLLTWVSGALTALLACAMLMAMRYAPEPGGVLLERVADTHALMQGAARAAGYAAMNMALAISAVCRSAGERPHVPSLAFGGMTAVLLYMGNALYLRHPEWLDEPFPIVQALRCFGTGGFRVSILLLWLAVLTSLTAVLRALDGAAEGVVHHPAWRAALVWCAVLAAARMGFAGIVNRLYAPAGALCLLLVFAPMLLSEIPNCRAERNA